MIFGREQELSVLNSSCEQMRTGRGSVLFLTGEAGLGKTTLVHEWRRSLTPSPLFLESACSIPIGNIDVGRLEALQPWADIIAAISDFETRSGEIVPAGNQIPQLTRKPINLKKLIHDAAPAWAWAIPLVGDIAHAALETSRLAREQREGDSAAHRHDPAPPPGYSAQNQQQVFQQYANILTRISTVTPLVIFLDDLHWADASSCNLLFYLSRQIATARILIIATYRPDDAALSQDGKGHPILTVKNEILRYNTGEELPLSYLDRSSIRSLLNAKSASYIPDDRFEEWLENISDGNALFATQYIDTLFEDNKLDARLKFVGDYDNIAIPRSALAVVEERTRKLDKETRKLLCYATAEGEEFTAYVLERISKREPMELLEELATAAQQGLIVERGSTRAFANATTSIFGFSHALFHKALYNQLLESQKTLLHRQCFEILKGEWDRLEGKGAHTITLASKLLTHARQSGQWKTAADVALATAYEMWKTFNEAESLAMIGEVLNASAQDPSLGVQVASAVELRANIDHLHGRLDASFKAFAEAEEAFRLLEQPQRMIDCINASCKVHKIASPMDLAIHECERALRESERIGYRRGAATALNNIGNIYWHSGEFERSMPFYERALTIAIEIEDSLGEANTRTNIGLLHWEHMDFDAAMECYETSLPKFVAGGDKIGEANVLGNIGNVHFSRKEYDEAVSFIERAMAIDVMIGNRQGEGVSLYNLGYILAVRGSDEEAMTYYGRALEIAKLTENRLQEATILNGMGAVARRSGDYLRALALFEPALSIGRELGRVQTIIMTLANIGNTKRLMGEFAAARAHLLEGYSLAHDASSLALEAEVASHLSELEESEAASAPEFRVDRMKNALAWMEKAVDIGTRAKADRANDEWSGNLKRLQSLVDG